MHDSAEWVLKQYDKNAEALSQIEAAMAAYYLVLLGPDIVPEVSAVYRVQSENDTPAFFATVSKMFSNYMSLGQFLGDHFGLPGYERETAEKVTALIENGLPEIMAASYFLVEDDLHNENIGVVFEKKAEKIVVKKVVRIDFDMSAYSMVSQSHLRGQRAQINMNQERKFSITTRDLNGFPKIQDTMLYYWLATASATEVDIATRLRIMSPHGYSEKVSAVFARLNQNKVFLDKSYLVFLKSILIPDEKIESIFASHILDPVIANTFAQYFIDRNDELRNQLLICPQFNRFWKTLSVDYVKSIFDSLDINPALSANYYAFCREMMREDFMESLRFLWDLSHSPIMTTFLKNPAKDLYEKLHHCYRSFREVNEGLSSEIEEFISNVCDALRAFTIASMIREKEMNHHNSRQKALFHKMINNTLSVFLKRCCYLNPAFEFDLKKIETHPTTDEPICLTELNSAVLVSDILSWMIETKVKKRLSHSFGSSVELANQKVILSFLKIRLDEFERNTQNETYLATSAKMAVNASVSVVSFFSSFVSARPAVQEAAPAVSPLILLQTVYEKAKESRDHSSFSAALSELVTIQGADVSLLRKNFFSDVVQHYVSEFLAMDYFERERRNPNLSAYLIQNDKKLPDLNFSNVVALLEEKIGPKLVVTTDAVLGDWDTVLVAQA